MKKILSILAFVFPILVIGQTQSENYIKTTEYQKKEQNENAALPNDKKIENITYFDGLGRPKQNISIRAGGQSQDIITPIVYDEFGRQALDYLPYANATQQNSSQAIRNQNSLIINLENYYSSKFSSDIDPNNKNPYSEKVFEPSPLNRVLEQGAPGADWSVNNPNSHTIKFDQVSNKTNDQVRLFTVEFTPSFGLGENGYYSANELFKSITKDENWKQADGKNYTTEEFKDKLGRVVLKRAYNDGIKHDTYYVYDDYGNLTYVIPPKVTTSNVSATELSELCYQYKYDDRNRLVEKKIPGKGWEYIVYNKLDQPILTQDANQAAKNPKEWLFTKYDAFGRVAYTGILNSGSNRNTLQTNANNYNGAQWVVRGNEINLGGASIFYNNGGYPNAGTIEILTVNYYDNYEVGNQIEYKPASGSITWNGMAATNKVKGLPTVTRTKVLGITENKWITTASYYDEKGRPWETYLRNEYLDVTEWTISQLDFTGKVVKTASSHQKGSATPVVTIENFEYDHMGRLVSQYHCIGTNLLTDDCTGAGNVANLVLTSPVTTSKTEVASTSIVMDTGFIVDATVNSSLSFTASIESGGEQIVANHYDELGQLDYKNVGGKPSPSGGGATGGGGLQTVDYTYNIRGWLKEINDPNNLGFDLFAFGIKYNTPDYSPSTRGLFNGNISETHWITANDNKNRNYRYQYDALNRIVDAINIGENEGHRYRVINITYDKNGNLLGLHRNGWKNEAVSYGNIDVLEYSYDSGNKLTKVKDYGSGDYGFKDGTNTGNDYAYDVNGNLTSDANKQITSILYNHLNLPTEVKFNNSNTKKINFVYAADRTKLRKITNDNGNETTTDYAGGYVYENSSLKQISQPEGYIEPKGDDWQYVYYLKDHLDNVRITYADDNGNGGIDGASEIRREQNYYPFGLEHKGYNTAINGVKNNLKTFQDQEFTEDLGLNTHEWKFRMSDPAIGRFWQIDPLAEKFPYMTTYQFAGNKPTWSREIEGLESEVDANEAFVNMVGSTINGLRASVSNLSIRGMNAWSSLGGGRKINARYVVDGGGSLVLVPDMPAETTSEAIVNSVFDVITIGATVIGGPEGALMSTEGKVVAQEVVKQGKKAIGPIGDAGGDVMKQLPENMQSNMKTTKNGQGTIYKDPNNPRGNNVRTQTGNPNSSNPAQQQPYTKQVKNGKMIDKNGNQVKPDSKAAHQSTKDFKYQ